LQSAFETLAGPHHEAEDNECARRQAAPATAGAGVQQRAHFTLDADQCVPVVAARIDPRADPHGPAAWHRRTGAGGWLPGALESAESMPVNLPPSWFLDRAGATIFVGNASDAERHRAEERLRAAVDACLPPR
jgi:hypothetical protein